MNAENPAAFPCEPFGNGGMRLRDYFAAKAMAAIVADPNSLATAEQCAESAYRYADAMLAERQKGAAK